MDIIPTTFTQNEVRKFLEEDGYIEGTEEYIAELNRRYRASECETGRYVERMSWDGVRRRANQAA